MPFPPESTLIHKCQRQQNASGISILQRVLAFFLITAVLLSVCYALVEPVDAQPAATVTVQPPDLTAFPDLTVEFKCLDGNKQPITTFNADQIVLTENGETRPIEEMTREYRGVHFALAINGDREMDLRDSAGVSRYEKLSSALKDWAAGYDLKEADSVSLVTNEGEMIQNSTDLRAWRTALDAYQPNFRLMTPDLASLEAALQSMQEGALHFGVDQALLYITPPPTPAQIAPLNALTQVARSAGVRVDVWMVGEDLYLSNDQGRALTGLAADTGGQFFHFTGTEGIPDLEALHANLGYVESLVYTSALKESGSYSIGLTVDLGDVTASGEGQPFQVEVAPPNPMFLSPPVAIERQWVGEKDTQTLIPSSEPLSIMIEFPDRHPRDIHTSRLLVDGVVVTVNDEPPFDTFTWDLSGLQEDGEHIIQIEVEDQLGLTASTIETPVQVTILTPQAPAGVSLQKIGAIAAGIVAVAALLLLIFWLLRQFWQSRRVTELRGRIFTPVVDNAGDPTPADLADADILATFVPLASLLDKTDPGAVAIFQPDTILTDNAENEGVLIENCGIGGVSIHVIYKDDVFWLANPDTPNSVWVNYQPVGDKQVRLNPGDLVHFGKLGFRFTINPDSTPRKVTVSKYEPLI